MRFSTKPRTRKHVKGCGLLLFARDLCDKYEEKLIDTATRTGLDAVKTVSKNSP